MEKMKITRGRVKNDKEKKREGMIGTPVEYESVVVVLKSVEKEYTVKKKKADYTLKGSGSSSAQNEKKAAERKSESSSHGKRRVSISGIIRNNLLFNLTFYIHYHT